MQVNSKLLRKNYINDEILLLEGTKNKKTKVALHYYTRLSISYVSSKKWKMLVQQTTVASNMLSRSKQ